MATLEEINTEIARRTKIQEIDEAIAKKQGSATDKYLEPTKAIGASVGGAIAGGLSGVVELLQTGDLSLAVSEIERVQKLADEWGAPQTEAGRSGLQSAGQTFRSLNENIISPAVSGSAGLLNVAAHPYSNITQRFEPAKQVVRDVRSEGLGKFMGDDTFEATGNPALATIATVSPDIMDLFIPAKAAGGAAKRATARQTKKVSEAQDGLNLLNEVKAGNLNEGDIAKALQGGSNEDISRIINADPNFYRAADELGIDVEPTASFASQNPQFRSVSNALEVLPGSTLEPQAKAFIEAASKSADDLIEAYGGTLDKGQLGLDFKGRSIKAIDDLYEQTDKVYSSLRDVVDERQRFSAPSTVAFLEDLASKDKLSPKLKSVLNQLKPRQVKSKGKTGVNPATGAKFDTGFVDVVNPTLGKIDILRKNFGQAIGKKSGAFKDQETGLNKALYARLSNDMDAVADSIGGDALELSNTGKALTVQRKQLEDNTKKLLGNDLTGSITNKVSGALKSLVTKSDVESFVSTVNAIPAAQRGEIVLSSLNDVFKGSGVNQQALSPTAFSKWYDSVRRSPAASKALFNALPDGSKKQLDNLALVSKRISESLQTKRPTGVVKNLFNDEAGFLRKMLGNGAFKAAVMLKGGPVGSAAVSTTEGLLKNASNPAKSAASLLSSPEFKNMIREAASSGYQQGAEMTAKLQAAEKRLMKTKKYKKWVDTLAREDAASITGGVLGYLLDESSKEESKP